MSRGSADPARLVLCPVCKAGVGKPCRAASGAESRHAHRDRGRKAEALRPPYDATVEFDEDDGTVRVRLDYDSLVPPQEDALRNAAKREMRKALAGKPFRAALEERVEDYATGLPGAHVYRALLDA